MSERLDSGLQSFAALLSFLGKPVDPEHLRHEMGLGEGAATTVDLLRAAKRLSVRARSVRVATDRLAKQPLPALVAFKSGKFGLLLQANDKNVLIVEPETGQAGRSLDGHCPERRGINGRGPIP